MSWLAAWRGAPRSRRSFKGLRQPAAVAKVLQPDRSRGRAVSSSLPEVASPYRKQLSLDIVSPRRLRTAKYPSVKRRPRVRLGPFASVLVGLFVAAFVLVPGALRAATPVVVEPVTARHGMVVAAHPQAAEAGVAVLKAGGNAIDAAVATSLALGVAEPYGSGLGGKLMLLYYEARSGRTYVVDGMDAAGSLDIETYRRRPDEDRSYGYGSVCVPGLPAGLWAAHQKWGVKKWADDVQPAIALARAGFRVLPKTVDFMEEQERKLRRGDAEIARLYLPGGRLPTVGMLLANPDLAHTMELFARDGRDGFYCGPVAQAIVQASEKGGGVLTLADFSRYEARITEPLEMDFRGYRLVSAPPPASGPALFLTIMKALEDETFGGGPLRTAANHDQIGRVWRVVQPLVSRGVGDASGARANFERLISHDSIRDIRAKAASRGAPRDHTTMLYDGSFTESPMAATTHFIVADSAGNIVSATQSQSLHFGAGVVPPGTGVVLNDSMSNFGFVNADSINFAVPGKRARSTISPTIVFRAGKPVFAIGIPGAARIPTAMLQGLLDRLTLNRPLAEAIGDTRVHFVGMARSGETEAFEAEQSFPAAEATALRALGWRVVLPEAAGRGRHFGGLNAIEFNPDGSITGYPDPRRTNAAVGW
jgi:gamma-glutamyltranspeptidase/glutathione hydrolase